jgi:hypothetical protein
VEKIHWGFCLVDVNELAITMTTQKGFQERGINIHLEWEG